MGNFNTKTKLQTKTKTETELSPFHIKHVHVTNEFDKDFIKQPIIKKLFKKHEQPLALAKTLSYGVASIEAEEYHNELNTFEGLSIVPMLEVIDDVDVRRDNERRHNNMLRRNLLVTPSAPPLQTPSAPPLQTPSAPPLQTPSAPPLQTPSAPPLQTPSAPVQNIPRNTVHITNLRKAITDGVLGRSRDALNIENVWTVEDLALMLEYVEERISSAPSNRYRPRIRDMIVEKISSLMS